MSLFTVPNGNGGGGAAAAGGILYANPTATRPFRNSPQLLLSSPLSPRVSSTTTLRIVAAKKVGGRYDSKNRRSFVTTTTKTDEEQRAELERGSGGDGFSGSGVVENAGVSSGTTEVVDDGFVMPKLPGEEPDFWEGPQWDALGFFIQYMWAFGIVFALVACGIAVATYNQGATDFKETPAYKESVQSRELLEEPETSGSDVFESNPTEMAPSLE